jgi:hypothetical protein
MAQTLERLLQCSGVALELSKCSYYVIYWQWLESLPTMMSRCDIQRINTVQLTPGSNSALVSYEQLVVSEAHKMLGVWISPDGNEATQAQYLHTKSHCVASLTTSSKLPRTGALFAYKLCWLPAITYSLSTTTLQHYPILI